VQNALEAGPDVLADAEPYIVQYCEEMLVRYPAASRPNVHSDAFADPKLVGVIYVPMPPPGRRN
jgi:hypothetical protein